MPIRALGDAALLLTVGQAVGDASLQRVVQLARAIHEANLAAISELVPAFTTVTVHLRANAEFDRVRRDLEAIWKSLPEAAPPVEGRDLQIPVVYGGEDGPDLAAVAEYTGLEPEEVVRRHAQGRYRVHAVGFAPGFPYLAGLEKALHCPRRAEPRVEVPAGSVGIGGNQTGVYPLASPGGWQLIGRSGMTFFDATADPPTRFRIGDWVRFRPVESTEAAPTEPAGKPVVAESLHGNAMEVLQAGLQTMVQDLGRPGWQDQGVPVGGAMDAHALRLANVLVGNSPDAAGLEWTLKGPRLRFLRDTVIAITGAGAKAWPVGHPISVAAGQELDLGETVAGCRGVLAVAGGLDVPRVLGGRGTYLRASFGGFGGRVLRTGDRLPVRPSDVVGAQPGWTVFPRFLPVYSDPWVVRVVRGPQAGRFSAAAWRTLFEETFEVSPHSDRMGVRLLGRRVEPPEPSQLTSEGVAAGTIQVPANGHPIVLMADRQSLGGYPKMANVISVDLRIIAQARPRSRIRFVEVGLPEAVALREAEERDWGFLGEGVRQKLIRRKHGDD